MIVCEDLVRIYRGDGVEVQALQGLTLRVDEGELVAVVGASGSGKSTLLAILGAQDLPSAGHARVAGRDLAALDRRGRQAYRRNDVGFVWQQTGENLVDYLSAAANVELPMLLAGGRGRRERRRRALELLDLLEVADLADRRPQEMSGGQQQRVALAIALANAPRVLLADEPTGQLDEGTSAEVLEAIRTVNTELGVTALVVTHDRAVSDHVSRTVQIRDGRVSGEVVRHGTEHHLAEEFTVLDKVGRLQLPQDYVERLGLADRVRLTLEPDHVQVHRGDSDRADDDTADDGPGSRPRSDGRHRR
ncbi:ABC transporter ATP-binding protein [Isoptericola sp. b441]|uniref:ABC transporter ATP-binding protein n=1 Tax=Actinotalea lenta TaxID=3064654 RepID=A0ABT9DD39_9CELL|nr:MULTISPECIES: ABC transporter ATP-binding protein [unclassified Isoptericola]MDO8107261.1 ABC transporter ATP-binding protein [Isoptericola sp. b441]MDO8121076.1 ABC transporter ATP-binding protein [Isoptericola sp. b490]